MIILYLQIVKIDEEIKQSKFVSAEQKAIINIVFTANKINQIVAEKLKKHNLNLTQYNVLRILNGRNGSHASCGEIRDVMLDKSPDVTRICNKLLEKNLIKRKLNPENKRQAQVSISEKGIKLLEKINPKINDKILNFRKLKYEELEILSNLLDKAR